MTSEDRGAILHMLNAVRLAIIYAAHVLAEAPNLATKALNDSDEEVAKAWNIK